MPQGPIAVLDGALSPGNVTGPLHKDSSGNLLVSVASGTTTPTTIGYQAVPGNATTKLGGNGATGDVLQSLTITPAVLNAGNVSITDGNTSIPVYVNAGNLTTPVPFEISFGPGIISKTGAWSVVTPVSVTAIAAGRFTA